MWTEWAAENPPPIRRFARRTPETVTTESGRRQASTGPTTSTAMEERLERLEAQLSRMERTLAALQPPSDAPDAEA